MKNQENKDQPTNKEGLILMGKFFGGTAVGLATVFALAMGTMSAANYLFPSVEEYLKAQGLDPAIGDELAPGMNVRIRDKSALSVNLAQFELFFSNHNPAGALDNYNAYAEDFYADTIGTRLCPVILPREGLTLEDYIFYSHYKIVDYNPLSAKELRTVIALHEIRHCQHISDKYNLVTSEEAEGKLDRRLWEADADVHAINIAAEQFGNPEIIKAFLYYRALGFGPHDTSLYIHFNRQGEAPPSADAIRAANREAESLIDFYGDVYDTSRIGAAKTILGENITEDSLVRTRLELYLRAEKYFAPDFWHFSLPDINPV